MNEHAPMYILVYHKIKTDILSGKYPVGGFLPPEGELMKQFGTSRTTIRRAISILKSDHLVHVQQGRGSEVLLLNDWPTSFATQELHHKYSDLHVASKFMVQGEHRTVTQNSIVDVIQAEIKIAKALGLETGTEVFRLQRVHLVNGSIYAYVVSYVPCTLTPGLETLSGKIDEGYLEFFEENYGISITSIEDTLTAVKAGFLESRLLNVPMGSPLLQRRRISFENEHRIEYSERINSPDLYELVLTLRQNPEAAPLKAASSEAE
jgi:GntR family transcriptional regulator